MHLISLNILQNNYIYLNFVYCSRYLFSCESWLSRDKGLRRSLRAAPGQVDPDSSALMRKNIGRRMFDDHAWLSVGYRERKSLFTRAQRLSVCLATLFLCMITNCMFYKSASEETKSSAIIKIGPIRITGQQLYNSVLSSLIVLPPIILITILFSRAAPGKRKYNICSCVNVSVV